MRIPLDVENYSAAPFVTGWSPGVLHPGSRLHSRSWVREPTPNRGVVPGHKLGVLGILIRLLRPLSYAPL